MTRKAFKTNGYTLYITTSIGGLIKTQLVDKVTREEVEQLYWAHMNEPLEDYLMSIGVSLTKVNEYLNAN